MPSRRSGWYHASLSPAEYQALTGHFGFDVMHTPRTMQRREGERVGSVNGDECGSVARPSILTSAFEATIDIADYK